MKQNITILGSTGSIGTNTLDVLSRHPDRFQVFALTAAKQVDLILAQCAQFKPQFAVMANEDAGRKLADRVKAEGLPVEVLQVCRLVWLLRMQANVCCWPTKRLWWWAVMSF